ncbi:Late [Abeliophyllum distichum]|uniref:Late n=1 Tax=Abeliophyllum distichum TaxID=126358 RepID=A0ABD1V380_9LAMI
MAEREQVRPLAPASERPSSDDEETALQNIKTLKKRRCIKCCGCVAAFLLIEAAVVLILIFTIFKVKDPFIKMNSVTVTKLDLLNGTTPRPGSNMSLTADVSVKNPNYASFKYPNTTTTISYRGTVIGDARGPPGKAKARRTMHMNVTVDIITDRILSQPSLGADINSGLIAINSYTRVGGRVKIMKIINKHVTVKMNCSLTINITSRAIHEQKCKRKVKL